MLRLVYEGIVRIESNGNYYITLPEKIRYNVITWSEQLFPINESIKRTSRAGDSGGGEKYWTWTIGGDVYLLSANDEVISVHQNEILIHICFVNCVYTKIKGFGWGFVYDYKLKHSMFDFEKEVEDREDKNINVKFEIQKAIDKMLSDIKRRKKLSSDRI